MLFGLVLVVQWTQTTPGSSRVHAPVAEIAGGALPRSAAHCSRLPVILVTERGVVIASCHP
jgi:hypothetical protein